MNRWIVYQRERFPLAGARRRWSRRSARRRCASPRSCAAASSCPSAAALLVAFVTSLLFFLQLRIADEFKDFEDDARYRPYRPVPRGLVTLRELAWVGVGAAASSSRSRSGWSRRSPGCSCSPGLYLALMTREFFAARWLKRHPVVYMASHMLILPLVDLYATACDWWVAGLREPPPGLYWFLVVSYLNGW